MTDKNQTETVTGILDWETPHEGRIRQWNNGPVNKDSDPYVPVILKERYPLRDGQMLTTTVVQKKSKNKKSPNEKKTFYFHFFGIPKKRI